MNNQPLDSSWSMSKPLTPIHKRLFKRQLVWGFLVFVFLLLDIPWLYDIMPGQFGFLFGNLVYFFVFAVWGFLYLGIQDLGQSSQRRKWAFSQVGALFLPLFLPYELIHLLPDFQETWFSSLYTVVFLIPWLALQIGRPFQAQLPEYQGRTFYLRILGLGQSFLVLAIVQTALPNTPYWFYIGSIISVLVWARLAHLMSQDWLSYRVFISHLPFWGYALWVLYRDNVLTPIPDPSILDSF